MQSKTLFYCNTGFDRLLSGETISPKLHRAIDAMALLLIPALDSNTDIYSTLTADKEYYSYLNDIGISAASLYNPDQYYTKGTSWGVDKDSQNLFNKLHISHPTPPLDVIKTVNSRTYSFALSQDLKTGIPGARLISTVNDLEAFTEKHTNIVLKPAFGNAGSGFIYSQEETPLTPAAKATLEKGDIFIGEPWLNKSLDIATLIDIEESGKITILGHHRNVSNRAGTFYANVILDDDPLLSQYRETLSRLAHETAIKIFESGYWGRVGLDSILYRDDNNREQLAFGFDINGRNPISTISYGIRSKLSNTPAFMYRFIARRRLKKFDSIHSFLTTIKSIAYTKETKRGVILSSPLHYCDSSGQKHSPQRMALSIAADDYESLMHYDDVLRSLVLK